MDETSERSFKRLLKLASVPPRVQRGIPISDTWSNEQFYFSFKFLILIYDGFRCHDKIYNRNGSALINIIETLIDASQNSRISISSREHCHEVEEKKLIDKNLNVLVETFKGKQFFQFGKEGYKERIIGFFDDKNSHLFEVCLLDLNHEVFPIRKKRVYA